MAITDSIVRLGASLIETIHTRLELASLEIEEEFGRYGSYFIWSLLGLFCGVVTILLLILLVLILFWDSHRELALFGLISTFGLATVGILLYLKTMIKNKPRLLAATLGELQNDLQALRPTNANPAQSTTANSSKNSEADQDSEGF
jgi:uncharacterized membrane protein YqjE